MTDWKSPVPREDVLKAAMYAVYRICLVSGSQPGDIFHDRKGSNARKDKLRQMAYYLTQEVSGASCAQVAEVFEKSKDPVAFGSRAIRAKLGKKRGWEWEEFVKVCGVDSNG